MKKFKNIIVSLAVVLGVIAVLVPASVGAVVVDPYATCDDPANAKTVVCTNKEDNIGGIIGTVVNTLLFILGAVAVIMIIIGGMQYTLSGGDAGAVTKAKNTILYSVIGLVVAFCAYAIVNWVLELFPTT